MSSRCLLIAFLLLSLAGCKTGQKRIGIAPEAQAAIDAISADISAGRDEKVYNEAAPEWRLASTLEQTANSFRNLRERLGGVKTRNFHTARVEQESGGASRAQVLVVQYQTTFERGEGMETFTLIERDNSWRLARYAVNSDALK